MGILDKIFKPKKEEDISNLISQYFAMINGYTPAFTTFEGSVYEMDLTRSVIHNFATHCSKLNMEVKGSANINLAKRIKYKANDLMDISKYLYRLATIREVNNNVLIIPTRNELTNKIDGFYPILANDAKVVEYQGELFMVYTFLGKRRALPFNEIGILNQFQYKDELFGENNRTMTNTLDLMHKQEQGIKEARKNGASIRFMGQLANVLKEEDINKERKRFAKNNLENNGTGLLLFDSKYKEIKQVISKPFTIDAEQMKMIKDNVYTHFGCNDAILQNRFNSAEWSAYYEGKIEPFAIQASMVHTILAFTERELANNNQIILTANRLQYLSPAEKLSTVTQLFDRGFLTHNQGLEIYNMPQVEGGDKYYIRKEYAETTKLDAEIIENEELENNVNDEGGIDE